MLKSIICHSGGARGSDTYWEEIGKKYNVITKAYSYKTPSHNSSSKIEISDLDYNEGINEIKLANKFLLRPGIHKYMNYLSIMKQIKIFLLQSRNLYLSSFIS